MFGLFKSNRTTNKQPDTTAGSTAVTSTAVAPAQEAATAVMEAPPVKSEAEIEREKLAALRQSIEQEAIPVDAIGTQFAAMAEHRSPGQIDEEISSANSRLTEVNAQHTHAVQQLLPVEAALKEDLNQQHRLLVGELNTRIWNLGKELTIAKLDERYARIDMAFLSKRKWSEKHNCALPLFAMFDVKHPLCDLGCEIRRNNYGRPVNFSTIPQDLWQHLDFKPLENLAQTNYDSRGRYYDGVRAQMTARFTGAIPQPVREIIRKAGEEFEAVYLVTEAPEWEMSLQAVPRPIGRDPLVVGRKLDQYWLLTSFDTTPAEDYVRREFTSGQLKQ